MTGLYPYFPFATCLECLKWCGRPDDAAKAVTAAIPALPTQERLVGEVIGQQLQETVGDAANLEA
eukprot:m.265791 g.265791  ORF g.265791 m.265791 type:complete len:65 (-) comp30299_c0_seq1:678-872(-)